MSSAPDDVLHLLRQRGRPAEPDDLEALMRGVAAAPEGLAGPEWVELIAPDADADLTRALAAWRAELARNDGGLDVSPAPSERLAALRAELARRGLDGFVVPRADEHQGEYVPRRSQRLAWLTGFAGSAGLAIVLADRAAIFVDGRYTLAVRQQVDVEAFVPHQIPEQSPEAWIAANLPKGGRLGFDPWLQTVDGHDRFARATERAGGSFVPVEQNPIDAVWRDRPAAPLAPVVPQPEEFSGETSASRRKRIGEIVAARGADVALLTAPDSIAWLLNVRGGDVPRTPFPLGFALLHSDGHVDLYMDRRKIPARTVAWLGNAVTLAPPEELGPALDTLGKSGRRVLIETSTAPWWAATRLKAAGVAMVRDADPVALPKACKNAVELEGIRVAHRRDGAAVSRFLAWLARESVGGRLREIEVSDRLQQMRLETGKLRDLSFDTISGAGPNGAVVHYHASPATERTLEPGSLYLVDSGGQYRDGTTDVTRTVAIGTPSVEMRDRFTRVLKGHIALAMARFPAGTTGSQLDTLARYALWQAGLDYDHGTGHGVGAYLSVHEGPQRISKVASNIALQPGMIVSNEPGYYKAGAYGIRIENLLAVREAKIEGADRRYLEFETLTLAPIDLACVEPALLTGAERAWLDAYHRRVRDTIAPQVDEATRRWLEGATRAI
ncbi:aminopeptidase P family protein [Enhydrobacter sp.]|jgi:Xaa-Pro aminopeptidase|uniref:aminopeptidase P family protein n=1 Tax=Enhydrobacter sp. TaxID=1894999 RepID=UPI002639307D|nr:aminopeptidase P family protein [Enhydrobacter sp.]WIM09396.1 MAG: Xaa-Pro aminopeptidase [Enhydrobacter sp.]